MNYLLESIREYGDCAHQVISDLPTSAGLIVLMGLLDQAVLYLIRWLIGMYPNRRMILDRVQTILRHVLSWYSYRNIISIVDPFERHGYRPIMFSIAYLILPEYNIYSSTLIQLCVGAALGHYNMFDIHPIEMIMSTTRPLLIHLYKTRIDTEGLMVSHMDALIVFWIEFLLRRPIALARLFFTSIGYLLAMYLNPIDTGEVLNFMERLRDKKVRELKRSM